MKYFTSKKTFKSFTRAISPFFKVNSRPKETVIAPESGLVIGVEVGAAEVEVGDVEVGVGAGEGVVRWFRTKDPAIPAIPTITTIPIMTATFVNPF